jgi:hypothetical protein
MTLSKVAKKSIVIGVVVVLVLVAFYVYNAVLTPAEEAKQVDVPIPTEIRKVRKAIDVIERSNLRWKDAVMVRGWVCKENARQDPREMYLVLKSQENTVIFNIEKANIDRHDVSKALNVDSTIYKHGFALTFPIKELKGGTYKMGFIISDQSGKYFANSGTVLTIPDDNDADLKVEKFSEPQKISNVASIDIQKSNHEMAYCVDKVEQSSDYITVIGWGYLKGIDATANQSYVLLRKEQHVYAFDSKIISRKDVTKVFLKDKLDLDSSGFISSIPVEKLEKGKYEVGVYIVNGDKHSIIFSKKSVDIAK